MFIVAKGNGISAILSYREMILALGSQKARTEMMRGVIDAGRKVRTPVQKAVTAQMNLKPGNYVKYVVANVRGVPRQQLLAFDIFSVKGGIEVDNYRGLTVVSRGNRLNLGRRGADRGVVKSAVWNNPRIFKRSFEAQGDVYAMRPVSEGTSTRAPKIFWTFGKKPNQPRKGDGRFASPGVKYGKVRRLFGPALNKELTEDSSLDTFLRLGPPILEEQVMKRLTKLMRY